MAQDRLVGIAIILIGAFLLWETFSFKTVDWDPLGLPFWPRILLGALGVIGIYLIVRGSLDQGPFRPLEIRAFAVLAGALVYVFSIDILGFLVATPLFMFLFHLALGGITRGHLVEAAILAVGGTGLIYYVFQEALWVQFPEGMLAPSL
ncbi:MAG: tripartite tricarboxylate transporter TctB family protein [Pseudomonadota bacterium]